MLDAIRNIISRQKQESEIKKTIRHIVVTMNGIGKWSEENKKTIKEACDISFKNLKELIKLQFEKKIPIVTVNVLPERILNKEWFDEFLNCFSECLKDIKENELIEKNKIKVSIFGKWYDLPSKVVDPVKDLVDSTKEYDNFFLNLCLNYDGQQEIVDSCRLIARQVKAGKLEVEDIDKAIIRDNLYSSYYIPPDLVIKTGKLHRTSGVLLFDSANSIIHFTSKNWPDFSKNDFYDALKRYEKY